MGRQSSEAVGDQVPQSAADPVAHHGIAHGLTDDEAHPGGVLTRLDGHRGLVLGMPIGRQGPVGSQGMNNQPGPPDTTSPANHRPELLTAGESGRRGEHGVAAIRPTARRDPCADGRPESPGRRGYASAAGTRGSSRGGGCWAGRCACPCSRSFSRLLTTGVQQVCSSPQATMRWSECTPKAPAANGRHFEGTHHRPASPNRGYRAMSFGDPPSAWRYLPRRTLVASRHAC
jgi:hypothetical protein